MTDQTYIRRVLAIFDGYDSGVHTLPDALVGERDRYQQVATAAVAVNAPAVSESQAIATIGETVANGGKLDLTPIRAARQAEQDYRASFAAMRRALDIVSGDLLATVQDMADEIITGHLAPAQAQVIAAVSPAHDAYRTYGATHAELLNAPKAARDALATMDTLERHFTVIRAAVANLRQATDTAPMYDREPLFSVIRNVEQVWPGVLGHRNMAGGLTPPWPTDPRGFLLYLAQPAVEAWCPTGTQQDQRWRDVFEERALNHQTNQRTAENLSQYIVGTSLTTSGDAA